MADLNLDRQEDVNELFLEIRIAWFSRSGNLKTAGLSLGRIIGQLVAHDGMKKGDAYNYIKEELPFLNIQTIMGLPNAIKVFGDLENETLSYLGLTVLLILSKRNVPGSVHTWAKQMAKNHKKVSTEMAKAKVAEALGKAPIRKYTWTIATESAPSLMIDGNDCKLTLVSPVRLTWEEALDGIGENIMDIGVDMYETLPKRRRRAA